MLAGDAAVRDFDKPKLDLRADSPARKSYAIPALEIVGFETLLNLANRRDAYFPDLGTRTQARATIGNFYTYFGQDGFGNADWH